MPLIADLRLDACQVGQAGNAIATTGLALIEQIVVQLAIPIDLAAVAQGLPDQCNLSIFLRSPAQRRFALGIETAGLDR